VTNDFHSRRARFVFREVIGDRANTLIVVSAPVDRFGPTDWWRSKEGMKIYLAEYLKLAYYVCRYGSGIAWLAGIASTALVCWLFLRYGRRIPMRKARSVVGR
jgi:uncharacterized SAM-binding protein YcdF (DUF218 family)